MWRDRAQAGAELGEALARAGYAGRADVIVLGIPRGGVEVARAVAGRLRSPLDVVVVRKIGAPGNPEFAAGAVDLAGSIAANPYAGVDESWLRSAAQPEHAEAIRRAVTYRAGMPPLDLAGRTAIIVDDGIATGLTAYAAGRWARHEGAARTVLAAPVIAPDTVRFLEGAADDVVALQSPAGFSAVGQFYRSFPQLSDEQVVRLLRS